MPSHGIGIRDPPTIVAKPFAVNRVGWVDIEGDFEVMR
jgi:hypothetical protein